MTEEERLALQAAQLRGVAQQSPTTFRGAQQAAMANPYVTADMTARATQDLSGREAALERQQSFANQLRGSEAPTGRSVGPLDVYVGPNWGESLAYAGSQALGGYLAGKGAEKEEGLSKARADKAAAVEEIRQAEMQEKQDRADAQRAEDKAEREAVRSEEQAWREEERRYRREQKELEKSKDEARQNAEILEDAGDEITRTAERRRTRADKVIEDARDRMDDAREAATSDDSLTETESKNKFRAEMLEGAIEDIEEVLVTGYDPGGFTALKDKATAATDFTRWAASDEGLKFKSAANTAKEQILRAATGAAAPETENQEYIETLVPRIGEGEEVVRYKLNKMREAQALLAELGGDNWNEAISRSRSTYNPPKESGASTRREERAKKAQARQRAQQEAPTAYEDEEKERRYQEWLANQ